MKKEYENPKAEKMEFDYSEVVVASRCGGGVTIDYVNEAYGCDTTPVKTYNPYIANEV